MEIHMDPEPRLPETELIVAGPLGAATAYGCWDAPRGMQWIALGGQSTGHTEALRIVAGSESAVHPLGWPADTAHVPLWTYSPDFDY